MLRSVPHILGLSQSTNPQTAFPARAALGWSGDGSPDDGALRNFAVGAVVQHLHQNAQPGRRHRLPPADRFGTRRAGGVPAVARAQHDANREPRLAGALVFVDPDVTAGQTLFHGMPSEKGARNCSFCHNGGGALNAPLPAGRNDQRATGAERSPRAPACTFPVAPGDGAFGLTPVITADRSTFCTNGATGPVVFRGDQSFSVPSTIEAADTAPFFHNNSADTLEEVVDFYRSAVFSRSISGAGNAFVINDTRAQPNGGVHARAQRAREYPGSHGSIDSLPTARVLARPGIINDARQQVQDAIRVLGQGNIQPYRTTALPALQQASLKLLARQTAAARADLEVARGLIAN